MALVHGSSMDYPWIIHGFQDFRIFPDQPPIALISGFPVVVT
jgi:hypothetical protein